MYSKMLSDYLAGKNIHAYAFLGAHPYRKGTTHGVRFLVYAPAAARVELVGDFNQWEGSHHSLRLEDARGLYSIFVPGFEMYDTYKFRVYDEDDHWVDKCDPFAFFGELRPGTASKYFDLAGFPWTDENYCMERSQQWNRPVHIYELHVGSWRQKLDGSLYSYEELAEILVPYLVDLGVTHVEFMPLSEHPLDGSWGYQSHGYFAMTSRYGNPKQLMHLINQLHRANIGVIFDFVPSHFVADTTGLAKFDGTSLYELSSEKSAKSDWGSLYFDLVKGHTRSFLASAASFYASYYHIDGIRFDAVSHLIYRRGDKNLGPNHEGLAFLQSITKTLHQRYPYLMLIAEDSTDYPNVTKPISEKGLGFDYKWDLGWMNDTLRYYSTPFGEREHLHHNITFSMHYYYSERFLLPLSHDEVVHGKRSMVDKMYGNYEQKFAQLRNLYGYQFTHPGKKLVFMGNEIAPFREWDESKQQDWFLLNYPIHDAFYRYYRELSRLYHSDPCLWAHDYDGEGFSWLMVDNAKQNVFAYLRSYHESHAIIVLNMSPTHYSNYEIGVPFAGIFHEILNSDDTKYSGEGMVNAHPIETKPLPMHGQSQRISLQLGAFSFVYLRQSNE
ncbi:MAG: 1,4-alpha-glucan branching protein GlgB [Bacilli bacterium]